ncbi:MAG: hypothetical protein ABIJ08_01750 [Nanoarchaeota archaeon]
MKRSQAALEFTFAVGVALLIFILIFLFTVNRGSEIRETKLLLEKENECLMISSLLTSAYLAGDGAYVNTTIDYNVSINEGDNKSSYKYLDVEDIECYVSIDRLPIKELTAGNIVLENDEGYINIQNV